MRQRGARRRGIVRSGRGSAPVPSGSSSSRRPFRKPPPTCWKPFEQRAAAGCQVRAHGSRRSATARRPRLDPGRPRASRCRRAAGGHARRPCSTAATTPPRRSARSSSAANATRSGCSTAPEHHERSAPPHAAQARPGHSALPVTRWYPARRDRLVRQARLPSTSGSGPRWARARSPTAPCAASRPVDALAQEGDFSGGWITADLVGPDSRGRRAPRVELAPAGGQCSGSRRRRRSCRASTAAFGTTVDQPGARAPRCAGRGRRTPSTSSAAWAAVGTMISSKSPYTRDRARDGLEGVRRRRRARRPARARTASSSGIGERHASSPPPCGWGRRESAGRASTAARPAPVARPRPEAEVEDVPVRNDREPSSWSRRPISASGSVRDVDEREDRHMPGLVECEEPVNPRGYERVAP